MAKTRMISSKFWADGWIRKINPLDRYLFLYFLTNEHGNISGIYELPIETMAFETGLDKEELLNSMLPRLRPKVYFFDNWVCIPNFPKHQAKNHPKVVIGVKNELSLIPSHILKKAIAYGYPMDRDTIASGNSDSDSDLDLDSNLTANAVEKGITYEPVNEEGERVVKFKGLKKPITVSAEPFDFKKQLERLSASPAQSHNIAAHYLTFKGIVLENEAQYYPALARIVKSAKELSGYNGDQIQKAFEYCEQEWPNIWTLETVVKRLPEIISKK